MENKKESNNNLVFIGILLLIPFHYLIMGLFRNLLNREDTLIEVVILLSNYMPIIIGMIISFQLYKGKASKILGIIIGVFLVLGTIFYTNTFFIPQENMDAIGFGGLWLFCNFISEILLFIFYGKIAGGKKALLMFVIFLIYYFSIGYIVSII